MLSRAAVAECSLEGAVVGGRSVVDVVVRPYARATPRPSVIHAPRPYSRQDGAAPAPTTMSASMLTAAYRTKRTIHSDKWVLRAS